MKEYSLLKNEHQQMLLDQLTLQTLHEQLTSEYESLVKERETLKNTLRDLRTEQRALKEKYDLLSVNNDQLSVEKETLKAESRSLNNLRAEHSKLKVCFKLMMNLCLQEVVTRGRGACIPGAVTGDCHMTKYYLCIECYLVHPNRNKPFYMNAMYIVMCIL